MDVQMEEEVEYAFDGIKTPLPFLSLPLTIILPYAAEITNMNLEP